MILENYKQPLAHLIPNIDLGENASTIINGLSDDSRSVRDNDLFFAYQGHKTDGRQFIKQAIENGASVIVQEYINDQPTINKIDNILIINLENFQDEYIAIIKRFYKDPQNDLSIYAITGTNGKTSCAFIQSSLLAYLNGKSAVIGTLGVSTITLDNNEISIKHDYDTVNTTPGSLELFKILTWLRDQQILHISLEATSHGIDQQRLIGIKFLSAIFTNLTHDHLDYHQTLENYQATKFKLFKDYGINLSILNIDDNTGRLWYEQLNAQINCIRYSINNSEADYYLQSMKHSIQGQSGILVIKKSQQSLHFFSNLIGEFNSSNILAVVANLLELKYDSNKIIKGLERVNYIPGRMERLINQDKAIFIDYAHTPDALEKSLKTLDRMRISIADKDIMIWCVFGCGGDRDKEKRPIMGKIASQYADRLVITSDNPRYEKPEQIIKHIEQGLVEGFTGYINLDNRFEAIKYALKTAKSNDIILIAGKGHETYQEIAGERFDFNDKNTVKQILQGDNQ